MYAGTGLTREPVSGKPQELEHKATVLEMGGLDSESVATGFWVRKTGAEKRSNQAHFRAATSVDQEDLWGYVGRQDSGEWVLESWTRGTPSCLSSERMFHRMGFSDLCL